MGSLLVQLDYQLEWGPVDSKDLVYGLASTNDGWKKRLGLPYIANPLSHDSGFYYATMNRETTADALPDFTE